MGYLDTNGLSYLWSQLKTKLPQNTSPIDGFAAKTTLFNSNGSISETDKTGNTLQTTFNTNGTITQQYVGLDGTQETRTITFSGNQIGW